MSGRVECRLQWLMDERHMSATKAAAVCGLDRLTIRKLRRGNARGIRFSTLVGLCKGLQVDVGSLLVFIPNGKEDGPRRARVKRRGTSASRS